MIVYPDTSAILALFKPELNSANAAAALSAEENSIRISDFSVAEFSAVIAASYRGRTNGADDLVAHLLPIDAWVAATGSLVVTEAGDIRAATLWVRRLDLGLRVPDALHLALCRRVGAMLLTYDARQAAAATMLGISLAD